MILCEFGVQAARQKIRLLRLGPLLTVALQIADIVVASGKLRRGFGALGGPGEYVFEQADRAIIAGPRLFETAQFVLYVGYAVERLAGLERESGVAAVFGHELLVMAQGILQIL